MKRHRQAQLLQEAEEALQAVSRPDRLAGCAAG